jgi:hypothetical protein
MPGALCTRSLACSQKNTLVTAGTPTSSGIPRAMVFYFEKPETQRDEAIRSATFGATGLIHAAQATRTALNIIVISIT